MIAQNSFKTIKCFKQSCCFSTTIIVYVICLDIDDLIESLHKYLHRISVKT